MSMAMQALLVDGGVAAVNSRTGDHHLSHKN